MKRPSNQQVYRAAFILLATVAACEVAAVAPTLFRQTDDPQSPRGWQSASPRPEIQPQFSYNPKGGPNFDGSLIITADTREGLSGSWQKTFPVSGGQHYRFHAQRKIQNVKLPRRSAPVRIVWQDDQGKPVPMGEPSVAGYLKGWAGTAEAEHPADKETDSQGWTEVSDSYQAPPRNSGCRRAAPAMGTRRFDRMEQCLP